MEPQLPRAGLPTGMALLQNPQLNKGTAFTDDEREALGLRGLLPPHTCTLEDQVARVMENFQQKTSDLERYIQLLALQERNETLLYRIVVDNPELMLPVLYTPTVGEACQHYGHIYRRSRGMYISLEDRGRVARVLANWPHPDVRVIVVTDGERILGLGDLGANGMGIPVGKLTLYTACGGVDPAVCMPVTLDVGTENATLREDRLYLGLPRRRLRGEEYDELVEEFVEAANMLFPHVLIQFEDFATANAFRILNRYRDRVCCFNDDIQGTGAVALSGLLTAARALGNRLRDHRLLFIGAGEAGVGIGHAVACEMHAQGLSAAEAAARCWFMDSQGLVVKSRTDLPSHKLPFAQDHVPLDGLTNVVEALKPTAIIGVSGQPGAFTREAVEALARANKRPVICALSNPTSKSECTAEQAYAWTGGRCIFASGSPFPPVTIGGTTYVSGQGNNAYIFPGVGLGVLVSRARSVTDGMFTAAAHALSSLVTGSELAQGRIYPSLDRIREVSACIAVTTAEVAYDEDLATAPRPPDLATAVQEAMYEPQYRAYV
jgi:malate dehydrogenase (oxaloacetate-decarboxylating)(NADP+)